jgi:hypothetical protein
LDFAYRDVWFGTILSAAATQGIVHSGLVKAFLAMVLLETNWRIPFKELLPISA